MAMGGTMMLGVGELLDAQELEWSRLWLLWSMIRLFHTLEMGCFES